MKLLLTHGADVLIQNEKGQGIQDFLLIQLLESADAGLLAEIEELSHGPVSIREQKRQILIRGFGEEMVTEVERSIEDQQQRRLNEQMEALRKQEGEKEERRRLYEEHLMRERGLQLLNEREERMKREEEERKRKESQVYTFDFERV